MGHLHAGSAYSSDTQRADPQVGPGQEKTSVNSMAFALMAMAREPFIILDRRLRVVAASRSYYKLFPIKIAAYQGRFMCEPSSLDWDQKSLKPLQDAVSLGAGIEDLEVELDVPHLGKRNMLLNVRQTADKTSPAAAMLVGLEDVTEARSLQSRHEERERLQAALLMEVHHRVANSLQLIASILSIKCAKSSSRETQIAIQEILNRLAMVASLERHLCASGSSDEIAFAPYLTQVCTDLSGSVLADDSLVSIVSSCGRGNVKSDDAASLGMIVTELVTNALKHGFPDGRRGQISIDFALIDQGWRLSVADDGIGRSNTKPGTSHTGIGTRIVQALAQHLNARVESSSGTRGTATAIICGQQLQLAF